MENAKIDLGYWIIFFLISILAVGIPIKGYSEKLVESNGVLGRNAQDSPVMEYSLATDMLGIGKVDLDVNVTDLPEKNDNYSVGNTWFEMINQELKSSGSKSADFKNNSYKTES